MKKRRDVASVLSLIGLSCLVQAWSIHQAVVPAPDAVRYVTMAQTMARDGIAQALRYEPEQPLFPALVWLSKATLTRVNLISPADWATAAQVAAAIPLILGVVVVYGLSRLLIGRSAAFASGIFFCLLPEFSRLGASGISDSVHLLFLTFGVFCAVRFFQSSRHNSYAVAHELSFSILSKRFLLWIFTSGVCLGVALLARAEALLFLLILMPALLVIPSVTIAKNPWSHRCASIAALACGLLVILLPYLWTSDALSPRAAEARLLGGKGLREALPLNVMGGDGSGEPSYEAEAWTLPDGREMKFGRKDFSQSHRLHGYVAAGQELVAELALASLYVVGGLAFFGIWVGRRQLNRPIHRFLMAFAVVYLLTMWQMAAHRGYLSGRHLLIVVVLSLGWAGLGALRLGKLLRTLVQSLRSKWSGRQVVVSNGIRSMPATFRVPATLGLRWTVVLLAAVTCLPRTLRPFNHQFTAHRQAIDWLAERDEQAGAVLDSRGWTALYSGRKTYRYEAARSAYRDPQLTYVIVEQHELEMQSVRGDTMRQLLSQAGEPVARFIDEWTSPQQAVQIYRWSPQRFVLSWKGFDDAR